MPKPNLKKLRKLAASRRFRFGAAAVLGVFVVLNIAVAAIYHHKTLPGTEVNKAKLSSVQYSNLDKRLNDRKLLPGEVKLSYKNVSATYKTSDLGLSIDDQKIAQASQQQRSWLPLANLLGSPNLPLSVEVDSKKFDQSFTGLTNTFKQDPVNAQISLDGGNFSIKPDSNGYKLDKGQVKTAIMSAVQAGKKTVVLPVKTVLPQTTRDKLKPALTELQKQQQTSVIFRYGSKNKQLTAQEIGGLYAASGDTYSPSDALIKAKITSIGSGFGIKIQNINEAVTATKNSLIKKEASDFTLVAVTINRTYTYCTKVKGVDAGNLAAFDSKLASTYADTRGWSLGGQVSFAHVAGGCNFTVWLTAADQMPSFGAICDTTWSCTVSPNVIINFDRWSGASDAWNSAGGALDEYRAMVINHETGHWLGFGHRYCAGPGQVAPVMQQQSISLQGCTFNAWPTAAELATLRGWLGL